MTDNSEVGVRAPGTTMTGQWDLNDHAARVGMFERDYKGALAQDGTEGFVGRIEKALAQKVRLKNDDGETREVSLRTLVILEPAAPGVGASVRYVGPPDGAARPDGNIIHHWDSVGEMLATIEPHDGSDKWCVPARAVAWDVCPIRLGPVAEWLVPPFTLPEGEE